MPGSAATVTGKLGCLAWLPLWNFQQFHYKQNRLLQAKAKKSVPTFYTSNFTPYVRLFYPLPNQRTDIVKTTSKHYLML